MSDRRVNARRFITRHVVVRKHPREVRPLPPHADGMILDRDMCSTERVSLAEPGHWQLVASPYAETAHMDGVEVDVQVYWMGGRDL